MVSFRQLIHLYEPGIFTVGHLIYRKAGTFDLPHLLDCFFKFQNPDDVFILLSIAKIFANYAELGVFTNLLLFCFVLTVENEYFELILWAIFLLLSHDLVGSFGYLFLASDPDYLDECIFCWLFSNALIFFLFIGTNLELLMLKLQFLFDY